MGLIVEATTEVAAESAAAPSRLPMPPRFVLGKIPVDRITMEYAAVLMVEALHHRGDRGPVTVVGPNAHLVTMAERDSRFAGAMRDADLAVPDGISVVWASRVLGVPIPERVTGGDLMERMCAEAADYGFRIFFLGGLPGAAVMAARHLQSRYPTLQICGTLCPAPGFESDQSELAEIRKAIADAAPDLVCVGFGAPKQEIWMRENRRHLNAGALIAVGAALDTQAGLRRRAPRWVQAVALEWLFRLLMEPRRLWRRYLIGNARFVMLVLRQWLHDRVAAARRRGAERLQNLVSNRVNTRGAGHEED